MRMQGFLWILPMLVFSLPVWACSPPPQWEESGFVRHEAVRLPKNARGLMFLPPSGKLRTRDFQVSSAEEKRAPRLKIRSFKGQDWNSKTASSRAPAIASAICPGMENGRIRTRPA
jgi:hypothetical protein